MLDVQKAKIKEAIDQIIAHKDVDQVVGIILKTLDESLRKQDHLSLLEGYEAWQRLLSSPRFNNEFEIRLASKGFRVYSQNDQDGIINEIFRRLSIKPSESIFAEFGCGKGLENNTHFLLTQGAKGLWMDCEKTNIGYINNHFSSYLKSKKLVIKEQKILRDNIDALLQGWIMSSEIEPEKVDLLSIDVDWNDYYIWEAIECIKPKVVCIEYNAHFPPPVSIVVPYCEKGGEWNGTNYFGASLSALNRLGTKKGYGLVGCSIAGTDAFFVRNDLFSENLARLKQGAEYHYEPPRFKLNFNLGHIPWPGEWVTVT